MYRSRAYGDDEERWSRRSFPDEARDLTDQMSFAIGARERRPSQTSIATELTPKVQLSITIQPPQCP
jgi:hypothetical protein